MNLRRCLLPLVVLAAGCGRSGHVAVSGVVELDGQPVENASILFQNDSGTAFGVSDAQGKFTLTTKSPNDGAAPGDYRVGVSKCVQEGAPGVDANGLEDSATIREPQQIKTKHLVPEVYRSPDTSNIWLKVEASNPNLKIELSSSAK